MYRKTAKINREGSRRRAAFTLIELLIVVAIIAILAAIAVPNFIEAQTRAKVSRVHSDFRTLALGIESYYVDHNTYIYGQGGDQNGGGRYRQGFRILTSPIAYVSSIPQDPFGATKYNGSWRPPIYELGAGKTGLTGNGSGWSVGRSFGDFVSFLRDRGTVNTWFMESDGPDNDDTTKTPYSTSGFPGWPRDNVPGMINMIYDTTNGTKSFGEIFRTGGVVPPGPAYQALFSMTN